MKINAILMDARDNVVSCVEEVPAGTEVVYMNGVEVCALEARETIPYRHKIAVTDIPGGGEVIRFGEVIGKTAGPIGRGCRVPAGSISRKEESQLF